MIDVHFLASPNGHKVSIMLEELGLAYRLIPYSLLAGDHLDPGFRALNPNNRLPVIVDHDPADGGDPMAVFESGAILVYLAEKTGRLVPADPRGRSVAMQWLMWQMASLGPMNGQAHHFIRYAPEDLPYPTQRYVNEAGRLLDVMEHRLSRSRYLAGDSYSIADIACWPWIRAGRIIDVPVGDRPCLQRWYDAIAERPAVIAGAPLPENSMLAGPAGQKVPLTPEQRSILFGDKMLRASRN
jgi:GST-like protein